MKINSIVQISIAAFMMSNSWMLNASTTQWLMNTTAVNTIIAPNVLPYIITVAILSVLCLATIFNFRRRYKKLLHKSYNLNTELMLAIKTSGDMVVGKYVVAEKRFYIIKDDMTTHKNMTFDEYINLVHPDDKDNFIEQWQNMLNRNIQSTSLIINFYNIKKKNYSKNIIRLKSIIVRTNVIEIVGTQKLMTDMDMVEVDLHKRINLLNTIYKTLPIGLEQYDRNGDLIESNKKCLSLLINADNIETGKRFNYFDNNLIPENIRKQIRDGESGDCIFEINLDEMAKTASGSQLDKHGKIMIELRFAPLHNELGKRTGGIILSNDVTDNYNLNRLYQRLYQRNNIMLETLPLSVELYNKDGVMTYFNKATENMYGIDQNCIGSYNIFNSHALPADIRERIKRGDEFEAQLEYDFSKIPNTDYYHTNRKDTIKIKSISRVVRNSTGDITDHVIISEDITQSVINQREIEDARKKMFLALKASNTIVWNYNVSTNKITYIDQLGNPVSEMDLDEHLKLKNQEDVKNIKELFGKLLSGKQTKGNFTFRYIDKSQSDGYRYCQSFVIAMSKNGKVVQITGTERDITKEQSYHRKLELNKIKTDLAIRAGDMVQWEYDTQTQLYTAWGSHGGDESKYLRTIDACKSVTHPDDRKQLTEAIAKMDSGDMPEFTHEFRVLLPGFDDYQYCEFYVAPYEFNEMGKAIKYTGFHRNNTHWHELNESITKSNKQKQLILDNIDAGLVYMTPDYTIQWENVKVEDDPRMKDVNMKDISNKCYTHVGRTEPCTICAMREAVTTKGIITKEIETGNGYIVKLVAMPVLNDNGEVEGVVIRINDYTEHRHMLDELRKAKNEAEASNRLKSAFLANMSHEIRTPLNAIVGFSELVMYTEDKKEKEEYNKIISANSEILLNLINDILDLSKIESGYMELSRTEIDVADIFKDIKAIFELKMKPEVKLIVDSPYQSCITHLDRQRLQQIITNFMTNAIKYTKEGSITMGYVKVDRGLKFYVTDTGIGISDENKKKVFKRFEKFDSFAQGTGLGLSICKAIVDANHGDIGFESEFGKGSTFWMLAPCESVINGKSDNVGQVAVDTIDTIDNMSNFQILIAEDNDSNYSLLKAILKKYDITRAVNGQEAVEKAKDHVYDMILMDIQMPIMNGLEATRKIRLSDSQTPIIAVSANAFDSDRQNALEAGCDGFVTKPINKNDLLNIIQARKNVKKA